MIDAEKQLVIDNNLDQGWFKGLNKQEVTRLVELSDIKTYSEKEMVYLTGEVQECLYCVIDGLVRVSVVSTEGDRFPLIMWESGSWFGEGAFAEESVMQVEASAVSSTKILVTPIAAIDKALDNGATFYKNILRDMANRAQLMFRLVDMLLFKTLQARVATRILHLITMYGEPVPEGIRLPLEFSQLDLARMSGGSRQRVNKILGEWFSSGILSKKSKWYVVHDIEALEAEAK